MPPNKSQVDANAMEYHSGLMQSLAEMWTGTFQLMAPSSPHVVRKCLPLDSAQVQQNPRRRTTNKKKILKQSSGKIFEVITYTETFYAYFKWFLQLEEPISAL